MQLVKEQQEAVDLITTARVGVVTGGPGVGKTSCLKEAVTRLSGNGQPFTLLAPTGKAARRITEVTQTEASTIHRAVYVSGLQGRIIVDESSMVDTGLLAMLTNQLSDQHQLILIGDVNQLPPISPGRAFMDIVASGAVPAVHLKQVHRSAEQSWVCRTAPLLLQGKIDLIASHDFQFIRAEQDKDVVEAVRELAKAAEAEESFQVLTPVNKGRIGVNGLNAVLQQDRVRRTGETRCLEVRGGEKAEYFYVGDPVRQKENDYKRGVMNGETGPITDITEGVGCWVDFYGRKVNYNIEDAMEYLKMSYAMTVHSSQGSEYDTVVVVCHDTHASMWTRQLLYTAVTRTKKRIYIVGTKAALGTALRTDAPRNVKTTLQDRLRDV